MKVPSSQEPSSSLPPPVVRDGVAYVKINGQLCSVKVLNPVEKGHISADSPELGEEYLKEIASRVQGLANACFSEFYGECKKDAPTINFSASDTSLESKDFSLKLNTEVFHDYIFKKEADSKLEDIKTHKFSYTYQGGAGQDSASDFRSGSTDIKVGDLFSTFQAKQGQIPSEPRIAEGSAVPPLTQIASESAAPSTAHTDSSEGVASPTVLSAPPQSDPSTLEESELYKSLETRLYNLVVDQLRMTPEGYQEKFGVLSVEINELLESSFKGSPTSQLLACDLYYQLHLQHIYHDNLDQEALSNALRTLEEKLDSIQVPGNEMGGAGTLLERLESSRKRVNEKLSVLKAAEPTPQDALALQGLRTELEELKRAPDTSLGGLIDFQYKILDFQSKLEAYKKGQGLDKFRSTFNEFGRNPILRTKRGLAFQKEFEDPSIELQKQNNEGIYNLICKGRSDLGSKLHQPDYLLEDFGGDGDCLFHSLTGVINASPSASNTDHVTLRVNIVQELRKNPGLYANLIEDRLLDQQHVPDDVRKASSHERNEKYCAWMKETGVWGGEAELQAAANIMHSPIVCMQQIGGSEPVLVKTIFPSSLPNRSFGQPLIIMNKGSGIMAAGGVHFQGIVPVRYPQEAVADPAQGAAILAAGKEEETYPSKADCDQLLSDLLAARDFETFDRLEHDVERLQRQADKSKDIESPVDGIILAYISRRSQLEGELRQRKLSICKLLDKQVETTDDLTNRVEELKKYLVYLSHVKAPEASTEVSFYRDLIDSWSELIETESQDTSTDCEGPGFDISSVQIPSASIQTTEVCRDLIRSLKTDQDVADSDLEDLAEGIIARFFDNLKQLSAQFNPQLRAKYEAEFVLEAEIILNLSKELQSKDKDQMKATLKPD